MISNPIFIIGTERSGSNLLRLLLNAHPQIAIPHPPHVMRDMAPFEYCYGDLSDDGRLKLLAGDMARLVNHHFAPWPFRVEAAQLAAKTSVRSLYGVYAALYEIYLRQEGKTRWGCKSTFMYRHIAEIRKNHLAPRFLHLVRDPRDVAASAEQSIFSRFHPYNQARLWTEQQERIEQNAGPDILRVRYEDLVARPEAELRKIMEFLGEAYYPAQLQYFRGREATQLSQLSESWQNCAAPVSSSSVGRFASRLKPDAIALVELKARSLMETYGYPVTRPPALVPSGLKLLGIEVIERSKMFSVEARALFSDKNFWLRWRKRSLIQYLKLLRSLENGFSSRKNADV